MKLLYSNENLFMVTNVKNIMEAQGIDVFIKNEFSQGAIGEISAFDAWPEVWLFNEDDFQRATEVLEASAKLCDKEDWTCENCLENNASSFEICWNCNSERKSD
ncbi:DUF2007 domain-containing protein [Psychromonas sp. KJ10-10]|uniref:putative signal transducing protein n=1 Tax=Psychromonas sp. KJ10-10 TaxID=3391823 RepID=UPI0039B5E243